MGKADKQDLSKVDGGRDEDLGSVILTFQRNMKLFRVDEYQWVSVFPLMLKGSDLRFYKDKEQTKGFVENILFHNLVHMFQQEFSTKERENTLWLQWK